MKTTRYLCSCVLLAHVSLSACGDNGGVTGDTDAAPQPDAALSGGTAVAVAGDFLSGQGVASIIDVATLSVAVNALSGLASDDPVLRYRDGALYIINRFGHDNINVVGAESLALTRELSTGAGSNPQDVAVKGDLLYVAALTAPGVLVIDAEDNITTIDLTGLDPNDDIPDCNSVYLVDDTLVVVCGILDGFSAIANGRVAFIDTTDNTVIDVLELSTVNPFGLLFRTPEGSALGGDLLMPTVDFNAGLTTGCIERIAVTPAPETKGCLIDNSALGGYASGLAYDAESEVLYIAVTTGFDALGTVAHVVRYHAAEGMLEPEPITAPDERVFDLARCPTGDWVAADASGGIRVYGPDDTERTDEVLDIGLPPTDNGLVCY